MWEDFKTHAIHYLILLSLLGCGLWLFWFFSYNPNFQRAIVLTVAALYVGWGVVHHWLEKNLNFKIVIEYTAVAALAATLLWIMTGVS